MQAVHKFVFICCVIFKTLLKPIVIHIFRQHLQRDSVKQVQQNISASEIATNVSKQPQRLKDSLQLAKTFGTNHRFLKVNEKSTLLLSVTYLLHLSIYLSDAMAEKILKVNANLLNELASGDHSSESIREFLSGTTHGEGKHTYTNTCISTYT